MRTQRRRFLTPAAAALAVGLLAMAPAPAGAQGGAIPRTSWDKKPDLNGIWQVMNTANWDLEDHEGGPSPVFVTGAWGARPPGLSVVEGGTIPYKPEALAKREQNRKNAMPGKPGRNLEADPELNCFLPGVPRATYLPHPFQIFQSPNRMWIVYQFSYARREIFMNGKEEAPIDSWMGWSNARWEGDTLVDRRHRLQRSELVRSRRQLPQRRAACGRALHDDRSRSHHVRGDDRGSRTSSRDPGRSACRSIAGSKRTCSCSSSGARNTSRNSSRANSSRRPASNDLGTDHAVVEVQMRHRLLILTFVVAVALVGDRSRPRRRRPPSPFKPPASTYTSRRRHRGVIRICRASGTTTPSCRWSGPTNLGDKKTFTDAEIRRAQQPATTSRCATRTTSGARRPRSPSSTGCGPTTGSGHPRLRQ